MIIMIKKLEPCPVLFPKPAIDKVKMHGHRVEQNNPTEMKANIPRDPPEKIPMISMRMPVSEYRNSCVAGFPLLKRSRTMSNTMMAE